MNSKQWLVGLLAAAGAIGIAVVGCAGDTVNNYQDAFGGDSGIDVQVFLSLGCTAGKKECVNDSVARVCPADGSAWVAFTCKVGDKCDNGDCKPVAGGPTAACVPGDGACLPNNKALRCKGDGSGFEQVDCAPNTTCFDKGLCRGTQIVGAQQCSADKKSVMAFQDGFNLTKLADCPQGELCVSTATLPFTMAACKPAACDPAATCGSATVCGDPLNPTNDQTKFVASCVATPSGYKLVGAPCTAGTTCNPTGAACNQGNRFQAACTGNSCTPSATRCAPNGQGVQTCKADGTWDATATQCNLGAGERCLVPLNVTGKAVCGDPICQFALGICDEATGGFRPCDANGKLQAAQPCTMGRCVRGTINATLPPPQNQSGVCQLECTPASEDCPFGGNDFRVCEANGKWGTVKACPTSDGAIASCRTFTDPVTNLSKHVCNVGLECSPGDKRCLNGDGGSPGANGTDSIEVCGADGKFGAPQLCAVGSCSQSFTGGAICAADCVPGATLCDPAGTGKFILCPSNGKLPAVVTYDQTCPNNTTCKRAGARSIGCVQCVGPNLTDQNTTISETRCLLDDGGLGGGSGSDIQGCKADNTWDTAFTCSGGPGRCASSYNTVPSTSPGGVSYAYCF